MNKERLKGLVTGIVICSVLFTIQHGAVQRRQSGSDPSAAAPKTGGPSPGQRHGDRILGVPNPSLVTLDDIVNPGF